MYINKTVSIELPRSAVLWALENSLLLVSTELLRSNSSMDTFSRQPKSVHRTAKVRSFMVIGFSPGGKVSIELPRSGSSVVPKICVHRTAEVHQFYGHLTLDNRKVSIELPRSAVLWMLVWPAGKVSIELPRSSSSAVPENGVHRTAKVRSSIHTKKVSIELPRSAVLWTLTELPYVAVVPKCVCVTL
jgi:hypothetical protein